MTDYTANEIVDILLVLGECQRNYRKAAALYGERFPDRQHPNHGVIRNIEIRSRRRNFLRVRRRRNEQDHQNNARFMTVLAMVHLDPHISLREIERHLGIPRATASRYLRSAEYHPYHIILNQALIEEHYLRRMRFCEWAVQQINNDNNFFIYVLFSDEATFQSTGVLNRHNSHYWSPVNPHWMQEIDHQHRWSITVWCGIVNGYLVGPYFFDRNVGRHSYLQLLRDELPILLENVDLFTRARIWQQDGAAPHYAIIVRDFPNEIFQEQWIGRGGPVEWPPRSPDLTSPDFYLWGYLREVVYRTRPTTRKNMIERIRTACLNIQREVLLNTIRHFHRRIELCRQVNGATFEHLID